MAISSIGTGSSAITDQASSSVPTTTTKAGVSSAAGTSAAIAAAIAGVNNSSMSQAIRQALAQVNAGGDPSGLLSPTGQQSTSDFMNSLFDAFQASPADTSQSNPFDALPGYPSSQGAAAPVALNSSSPTFALQKSIQSLISQLDGNNSLGSVFGSDSGASSALLNLQQSFNSLVTASGGNPSQASLQSFLKMVAANIEGSASLGSMLDISA